MRIGQLSATGWRNLAPLSLPLGPRLTVLYGDNGQGKTNVIEAIYYLATLRSFRTSQAADLVAVGLGPAGLARVSADVESTELQRKLQVTVGAGGRTVTVDGKVVRGSAAIFGALSVVLFVPEDLLLLRAPPMARRRFLDLAVFNVERAYYKEASAFQRVLKSRNSLLRQGRAQGTLLETYDEELARAGARLVVRRRVLVSELGPRLHRYFVALHGAFAVELLYRSDPSVEAAPDEPSVSAALLAGLRARHELDQRRRFTGFGPQTDDLEIVLGGRLARTHASQGQIRSLVLALKMAELANVEQRRGEAPVLLLDDVPSELDPQRREHLFQLVSTLSCQTVISVSDRQVVPPLEARVDFAVAAGIVSPSAAVK
ncbi:MAG: replication and repair protein RecF [Myxococcales bacterium]|nr:replication and repair protein RecF [Myxococcales bacterium]